MKKIIAWIVVSSKDPTKFSLTIKGILTGVAPILILILGLTHITVSDQSITEIIDGIVMFIQAASTAVAAVMIVWGIVRKAFLSAKGENRSTENL